MRYDVDPDFERKYFHPGQVHTRELKWGDWPAMGMLYCVQGGWLSGRYEEDASGKMSSTKFSLQKQKALLDMPLLRLTIAGTVKSGFWTSSFILYLNLTLFPY